MPRVRHQPPMDYPGIRIFQASLKATIVAELGDDG